MKKVFWSAIQCPRLLLVVLQLSGTIVSAGAETGKVLPAVEPVKQRFEREEVFVFAQEPVVRREGDQYRITFSSKGKCDATVAVVDKNGKVVRHLASGVLGANAPLPFKKDTRSQALIWDGRDDAGRPVPGGCKVRVGLGLKVTYDKAFADPFVSNMKAGIGMACDREGYLYTAQAGTIRRFTRNGEYERTLLPPQGGIAPEKLTMAKWVETRWGDKVMANRFGLTLTNGIHPFGTPVVGPDGRLAVFFSNKDSRSPCRLHIFGPDGSLSAGSTIMFGDHRNGYIAGRYTQHAAFTGGGSNHLAISPDGEWLYISGAGDAVLRYRWKDLKGPRMSSLQIFKGEVRKTGTDNAHFNLPAGVACDAQGNVYIADNGNDRIQVYESNGLFLRTIPVNGPQRIDVHPETSDVYALCWRSGSLKPKKRVIRQLVQISKEGRVKAAMAFKANWYFWHFPWTGMALDASAKQPAVWLADENGVFKVVAEGNTFKEILRLGRGQDPSIFAGARTFGGRTARAIVDPVREELYLSGRMVVGGPGFIRIHGHTGKVLSDLPFLKGVMDIAIGPDDLIYARTGRYGRFIARYTYDGKSVPFPKGVGKNKVIYTGVLGWSNVWQSGFDVSPNGDIAVSCHEFSMKFLKALYATPGRTSTKKLNKEELFLLCNANMRAENKDLPTRLQERGFARSAFTLLQVWGSDGEEKCIDAFASPTRGSGLRMDAQGSLYLGACFNVPGVKRYESLKSFKDGGGKQRGSLVKIGWKGEKWPLAKAVKKGVDPGLPGMTLSYRNWTIGGVTWAIQDLPAAAFDQQNCGCHHERFDLDGFARTWYPANHVRSILVKDSNGNHLLRVGRYGNSDSKGASSLVPKPDIGLGWVVAAAASDEALYAVDADNRRTLRAKIGYEVQEEVSLP